MKQRCIVLMILGALGLLPVKLMSQALPQSLPSTGPTTFDADTGSPNINILNPNALIQKHWIVAGKVTTLSGDAVAGVKIWVQPTISAESRLVTTDRQGGFYTEYWLNADLVKQFSVVLDANKKGFLKAHLLVDYGSAEKTWAIAITLQDQSPDPKLLSQADFVANLAPRLKKLGSADGLSAKSEKDYMRGVDEFLSQNRPQHALPFLTKVLARDPSCIGCRVMLGLAELASGDWDGANRNLSQGVGDVRKATNTQAGQRISSSEVRVGGGRPEPALALGVMESWRHQFERAASFYVEALQYAPQDPLALQELGRAELLLQNWDTANTYLGKAEAAGASPEVRLLRAEALLGAGSYDGANEEMTRYLNGRDVKTMPMPVRLLWAQIGEKKKIEAVYIKGKAKANPPIDYLHRPVPELKDLAPAQDQTPLNSILSEVGKRVAMYFRNFPNTVSLEEIHQERLSHKGRVGATLDQKFHYLCLVPTEDTGLGFTEYRASMSGDKGQPHGLSDGFMLTSGFASASIIFHPDYQAGSEFRYLGRQKIDGRDTFVIAFAQRPEKARLYGIFKMGATSIPTFSQGLAWVDAETYEIARLREDLLKPLPEVRLDKQTTEIEFTETHFKSITEGFWLPREVKVTVDWSGKSLLNKHEYSDFRLFNVGATEKIGNPKQAAGNSSEETPHQTPN